MARCCAAVRSGDRIKRALGLADADDMQWDAQGNARPSPPATSNAQRQREFRQRHPDYYRLRKARERAEVKARVAEMKRLERERASVVRREPLMLPAPVERIEIPGMNTIITIHDIEMLRARLANREPLPVPLSASAPARPPAAIPLPVTARRDHTV